MTRGAASIAARMSPQAMWSVTGTEGCPEKKRSITWLIISVMPAAVWYAGSVKVSSGSMMATAGRLRSVLTPHFMPSSSFEMTHESDASEPEAGMVSTAATGRARVAVACLQKKSHTSPS